MHFGRCAKGYSSQGIKKSPIANLEHWHPRRPRARGSQSGREKRRDESFRRAISPGRTDCPWVFEDGTLAMLHKN